MRKLILFMVLGLFLSACGAVFQDSFNSTSSGWYVGSFEAGEHSYQDGGYRVFIGNSDWYSWAVNPSAVVYGDIRVEVDAHKLSGPDSAEYGVLCRVDYDASSLYAGVVTSDGGFAIYKSIQAGPLELIDMAAMGFSEAVKQGGTANHIRLDCVGNTLTLFVNGTQLVQVTDDTLPEGETGVYSGTFDSGGTEVLFDNFALNRP